MLRPMTVTNTAVVRRAANASRPGYMSRCSLTGRLARGGLSCRLLDHEQAADPRRREQEDGEQEPGVARQEAVDVDQRRNGSRHGAGDGRPQEGVGIAVAGEEQHVVYPALDGGGQPEDEQQRDQEKIGRAQTAGPLARDDRGVIPRATPRNLPPRRDPALPGAAPAAIRGRSYGELRTRAVPRGRPSLFVRRLAGRW